jgi:hypothetical protein
MKVAPRRVAALINATCVGFATIAPGVLCARMSPQKPGTGFANTDARTRSRRRTTIRRTIILLEDAGRRRLVRDDFGSLPRNPIARQRLLGPSPEQWREQPGYLVKLAFWASVHFTVLPFLPFTWQASDAFQLGFAVL